VYRSSLMTYQTRDLIPLLPKACRAGQDNQATFNAPEVGGPEAIHGPGRSCRRHPVEPPTPRHPSGRRGSDQRSRHRDYGDPARRIRAAQLYRAGPPHLLCPLRFRLHRIARAGPEQVAWRQRRGVAPNRVIDILARGHTRVARLPGPAE
jgi:hypothetical protein